MGCLSAAGMNFSKLLSWVSDFLYLFWKSLFGYQRAMARVFSIV
jgi:hypothetical protein